ncbi:MAG: hypothetical protein WD847_06670 [Pirellulales bacterium]
MLRQAVHQQGVDFADLRFRVRGGGQAPPQVAHGLAMPPHLVERHAQVEEDERVLGPLAQVGPQQPQVADELPPLPLGRLVAAGMDHEHVREHDLAARPVDGRHDLLVDAVLKPQVRAIAQELAVVHNGKIVRSVRPLPRAADLHHAAHDRIGRDVGHRLAGVSRGERQPLAGAQRFDEPPQLAAIGLVNDVVGVHPEQPLPRGVPQRLVAGARRIGMAKSKRGGEPRSGAEYVACVFPCQRFTRDVAVARA